MDTTRMLVRTVCSIVDEKKGEHLHVLDLSRISSLTDFFILCQAGNPRQGQAISDGVREALKKEHGLLPRHIEGYNEAEWILLDYIDFVLHIFSPRAHSFYRLDRLWSDAEEVQPDRFVS